MKFFDCHDLIFTVIININRCYFSDMPFHDQFCLPLASSFLWCTDTKDSLITSKISDIFSTFFCLPKSMISI